MAPEDIITRLEAMAEGRIPTKKVVGSNSRMEWDTRGALQDLGKVYALFVDKQIVENIGLEIVDDNDPGVADREEQE